MPRSAGRSPERARSTSVTASAISAAAPSSAPRRTPRAAAGGREALNRLAPCARAPRRGRGASCLSVERPAAWGSSRVRRMTVLLMAAAFVLIIGGALLFTNGVEWLGERLNLGEGAVGSLLAAVGTALPESLIPVIAVLSGQPGWVGVAIGSIVGAPFMLATVAMVLVGLASLAFKRRRESGADLDAERRTPMRDLGVFVACFGVGIALGAGIPSPWGIVAALVL